MFEKFRAYFSSIPVTASYILSCLNPPQALNRELVRNMLSFIKQGNSTDTTEDLKGLREKLQALHSPSVDQSDRIILETSLPFWRSCASKIANLWGFFSSGHLYNSPQRIEQELIPQALEVTNQRLEKTLVQEIWSSIGKENASKQERNTLIKNIKNLILIFPNSYYIPSIAKEQPYVFIEACMSMSEQETDKVKERVRILIESSEPTTTGHTLLFAIDHSKENGRNLKQSNPELFAALSKTKLKK